MKTKMNRWLGGLLAMLLVLTAIPMSVRSVSAEEAASAEKIVPDTAWRTDADGNILIEDAADLMGMLDVFDTLADVDAFEGKTFLLTADIDLNPGWKVGSGTKPTNLWGGIGAFPANFNGQGHTIRGLYITTEASTYTASTARVGFINNYRKGSAHNSKPKLELFFKNVAFDNVYLNGWMHGNKDVRAAVIAGRINNVDLTLENISITNVVLGFEKYKEADTANGKTGVIALLIGCSETMASKISATNVTVSNVGFEHDKLPDGYTRTYVAFIKESAAIKGDVVTMTNCYFMAETEPAGATRMHPGLFHGKSDGRLYDSANTVIENTVLSNDFEEILRKIVNSQMTDQFVYTEDKTLVVRQAAEHSDWYAGAKPLSELVVSTPPDTDFETDAGGAFLISTAAELVGLSVLTKEQKRGKTYKLTADIDLNPGWVMDSGVKPTNIWTVNDLSETTIDGQGHRIAGLYLTAETAKGLGYIGLFGYCENAVVKDLILENLYLGVAGQICAGTVAGGMDGTTVTDVLVLNSMIEGTVPESGSEYAIGGIVGCIGNAKDSVIQNTMFWGKIAVSGAADASAMQVGAVVGSVKPATQELTGHGKLIDVVAFASDKDGAAFTADGTASAASCEKIRVSTEKAETLPANADGYWMVKPGVGALPVAVANRLYSNLWVQSDHKVGQTKETFRMRLVSSLDVSPMMQSAGFEIVIECGGESKIVSSEQCNGINTVYRKLRSNHAYVSTGELEAYDFFYTFILELDVDKEYTITVKTLFNLTDGTVLEGEIHTVKVVSAAIQ